MKTECFLYSLTLLNIVYGLFDGVAGPYYVVVKKVGKCPDSGKDSIKYLTELPRLNQTHYIYTINLTLPFDWGHQTKAKFTVYTKIKENWKRLINWEADSCNFLNSFFPKNVMSAYEHLGLNYTTQCPIFKKGHYYVKDVVLDFNSPIFKTMIYGDYKADFSVLRVQRGKKTLEGCVYMLVQIIPREKNDY